MTANGPIEAYNQQLAKLKADTGHSAKSLDKIANQAADESKRHGIDREDQSEIGDASLAIGDTFASENHAEYPELGITHDSTPEQIANIISRGEKPLQHWGDFIDQTAQHLALAADPEGRGDISGEGESDFEDFDWATGETVPSHDESLASIEKIGNDEPVGESASPRKTLSEEMKERYESAAAQTPNETQGSEPPKPQTQNIRDKYKRKYPQNANDELRLIQKLPNAGADMTPDERMEALDKLVEDERAANADADAAKAAKGTVKTQTAESMNRERKPVNEAFNARREKEVETKRAKEEETRKTATHRAETKVKTAAELQKQREDLAVAKEKARAETAKLTQEERRKTKEFLMQARSRLQKSGRNPELEKAISQWLESLADAASPFWDARTASAAAGRIGRKSSKVEGRKAWSKQ